MTSKYRTLESLSKQYDYLIWDSNALVYYLTGKANIPSNEIEFTKRLIERIDKGVKVNLLERNATEYLNIKNPNYNPFKLIQARHDLIEHIRKTKQIIKPNLKELKDLDAFTKGIKEMFDYKVNTNSSGFYIFSYGLVLSQRRGPTAIISNNLRITGRLWNRFANTSMIDKKKFGFYIRTGPMSFQEA